VNKYLPAALFAICILVGLILAWAIPPLWPAALAIALAGAALALGVRAQSNNDLAFVIDDLVTVQEANSELRKSNTALKAELADTREMIDELADVVEQVATLSMNPDNSAALDRIAVLQTEIAVLRDASAKHCHRPAACHPARCPRTKGRRAACARPGF